MFSQNKPLSINKVHGLLISFQVIGLLSLLIFLISQNKITESLLISLASIIIFYFINNKKIILFEAFTLFFAYSISVIISCLSIYYSSFQGTHFITSQFFLTDIEDLFQITLVYLVICYLFAYIGYKSVRKEFKPQIDLHSDGVSVKVTRIFIIIFAFIGVSNFYINVLKFAGGNPITYFSNISIRSMEFGDSGGTTAGYILAYTAGYLWLYTLAKMNKKITYCFIIYAVITVAIKASTGRVIGTLIFAVSYFMIYYFLNFDQESKKHKKYVISVTIAVFLAITLYFFRVTSSLNFNGQVNSDWIGVMLSFVNFDILNYYLVDKGNIPNVGVLMKIIDAWSNEMNFLYGKSLFTWVYGILPPELRPADYQISIIIKETWYMGVRGGALPPTGMGEMFVNFGYLGSIFGMYIFGAFSACIFNLLNRFNNFWYLIVYTNITLGFVLIYAKGEFDNLSLWYILPITCTYILLKFVSDVLKKLTSSSSRKTNFLS